MNVLVLNCGSSSIKYQLLNMDAVPVVLAKGIVEKIGLTYGSFTYKPEGKDKVVAEQPIMDHSVGMDLILKALILALASSSIFTLSEKYSPPCATRWPTASISFRGCSVSDIVNLVAITVNQAAGIN